MIVFALAGQTSQALHAYERANCWQEFFTLALSEGKRTGAEIKSLAIEVSGELFLIMIGACRIQLKVLTIE